VRGGERGAAKYKVKKAFTSCGVSFNKSSWAVDLEQLDYKKEDKQHRQQYTHMEAIQTVRPQNLLPVVFKECASSPKHKLCGHQCTHTQRAARRMQVGEVDLDAHIPRCSL
jgi:hypothetical protein